MKRNSTEVRIEWNGLDVEADVFEEASTWDQPGSWEMEDVRFLFHGERLPTVIEEILLDERYEEIAGKVRDAAE